MATACLQAQIQITRTKIEQPEDVMIPPKDEEALKYCEQELKMTQKWEDKFVPSPGKQSPLLKRFLSKKSQKQRIYAGPFGFSNDVTKGPKGIQGYYDAYFHNGREKGKALGSGGIRIAWLYTFKRLHLNAEKNKHMKVLLYEAEAPYDSVYVSYKNNKKLPYREWLKHYECNPSAETRYDVYKMYFLPTEDYQQQESTIQAKAEEEAKTYTMTNLLEVRYYIHYYGNLPYVEDAVKRSYTSYPVDNLPDLIERFGNLSIVEDVKERYIMSRTTLPELLIAYRKFPTTKLNQLSFEKKVLENKFSLDGAEAILQTIPNFSLKNELELIVYPAVKDTKQIGLYDKFMALFPNGKKFSLIQTEKTKVLQEIEADRKRREEEAKKLEEERLEKLAKFGPSGIFRESQWVSAPGMSIGTERSLECLHIQFNDNKKGYIYRDVLRNFGQDLARSAKTFLIVSEVSTAEYFSGMRSIITEYNTKQDVVNALYKILGGEDAPMTGRTLNESEQNALKSGLIDYENLTIPKVKKSSETWTKSMIGSTESATQYFEDGISGDLFRLKDGNNEVYGVFYGSSWVAFDNLENALRALHLYKKYDYRSEKGKR